MSAASGDVFRPGASNSAVGGGWMSSKRGRPKEPTSKPAWHAASYEPSESPYDPTFLRHARMYGRDPGSKRVEWTQIRPEELKFSVEADGSHDGVRARMLVPPIGNTTASYNGATEDLKAWMAKEEGMEPEVAASRWNRDRAVRALLERPRGETLSLRRDVKDIAEKNRSVDVMLSRAHDFAWARRAHLFGGRGETAETPAAKRAKVD
jgi:hypothetical protein